MVERIYDTLKGILYNDLPKNAKDQVVVYDRPIIGWYFGDRDVKPSSLSLIFYGTSIPLKDVSLGLQEYEHRITIGVDAGADNVDLSERIIQEWLFQILLNNLVHTRARFLNYQMKQ
jgi:hypothetical protein